MKKSFIEEWFAKAEIIVDPYMRNEGNEPFFNAKLEDAKVFIAKYGLPESFQLKKAESK